jgi:carbonic anhydrase
MGLLWNGFVVAMGVSIPLLALETPPLERLKEGNERYVKSTTVCHQDWAPKRTALVAGQKPFAIILSCSDSRVPPEIIFDQTLGHLFVVRVAGNIVDDFAIGSIEYGVSVLGASLILVLGHSNCGAVDAALKGMRFDNHIQEIIEEIEPAIEAVKKGSGNALEQAIKENVRQIQEKLKSSQPLLSQLFRDKKLAIEGGYYHLDTGRVEFLR